MCIRDSFRGYLSEIEIIAKAYANDWAAAITTEIIAEENESYLINKNKLIKTESYDENIKLYLEEGLGWIKRKYGFNSRWQFLFYTKSIQINFLFLKNLFPFCPRILKLSLEKYLML